MGVTTSSYVLGWFLTNLFRIGIVIYIYIYIYIIQVCFVFLVLCIPNKVLEYGDDPQNITNYIVWGYILFGLATMAQSYFLSVFFSTPKTAGDVSVIITMFGDFSIALFSIDYVQQ